MRILTLSDGFTAASGPSTGSVSAYRLERYANDAAFVTANSTATKGVYYNTTLSVIRYYDGSAWKSVNTATGFNSESATAKKILAADGSSGASWVLQGLLAEAAKTANYTLTLADDIVTFDVSGGAATAALPSAASAVGKSFRIVKKDSSFTAVTIDPNGSEAFDTGDTTTTLNTKGESITICSNGTLWRILAREIPSPPTAYTPTISGVGTAASVDMAWTRQRKYVQLLGRFTTGTVAGSEFRITLPASTVAGPLAGSQVYGNWCLDSAAGSQSKRGPILGLAGDAYLTYGVDDYSLSANPLTPRNGNVALLSSTVVCIQAIVPVTAWNG